MALQGTNISCITGEVFVKQGAVKKQVLSFFKLHSNLVKKSLPKVELELGLSKTIQGGD